MTHLRLLGAVFICFYLSSQQTLWGQKNQQKNFKSPGAAFLDDVYGVYESMGSILTLRASFLRQHIEGIHFDALWDSLSIDPQALQYANRPFLSAGAFPVLTADFRFSPIKPLSVRLVYSYQPTTSFEVINNNYDPTSYAKIQTGATVNIADSLQVSGDFWYTSSYRLAKFTNSLGFPIDQEGNAVNKQAAIFGAYHKQTHQLSLEIKQTKILFFEPRLRIDWINQQTAYFRAAEQKMDPFVKMGNTSEDTDGINTEYQKNFLTFSAGFTLRPFANVAVSGSYKLTPLLNETSTATQEFNIHDWSISLDCRLDRHFRFVTSLSINRVQHLHDSPYQSYFWDASREPQDPAANFSANTAQRALNYFYNERNVSADRFSVSVEYR